MTARDRRSIRAAPAVRAALALLAALAVVAVAPSLAPVRASGGPAAEVDGALPGASIYHLDAVWQDALGGELRLAELRGRPVVVVMFYGSCTSACPLLVHAAQELEAGLPPELRGADGAAFVMVTFDPTRDTADALHAYAAAKGLDRGGWHFLRGSALATRQLAALLGVRYRDAGNGMFSHSNLVTVLDRDGVIAVQVEGLGVPLDPAAEALAAAAR